MSAGLPRAVAIRAARTWHENAFDCVVLNFDDRHRRRFRMRCVRGLELLLDLRDAATLRGGDALVLEDGRLIEIVAAPETLVEISSPSPDMMARLAWHLGNRHQPVQIVGRKLRIRRDHVIEAMIEGLGGRLQKIEAPFDPEAGAYAGHHDQGKGHHHHHHD